mmetsp:Transcript_2734/g.6528  ORF Transcript_2734/g.6528 Transcript_2734/m.6528 type:complete len:164 (-) Transcript_2734:652-1143(-)
MKRRGAQGAEAFGGSQSAPSSLTSTVKPSPQDQGSRAAVSGSSGRRISYSTTAGYNPRRRDRVHESSSDDLISSTRNDESDEASASSLMTSRPAHFYHDYLYQRHKSVMAKISSGSSQNDPQAFRAQAAQWLYDKRYFPTANTKKIPGAETFEDYMKRREVLK